MLESLDDPEFIRWQHTIRTAAAARGIVLDTATVQPIAWTVMADAKLRARRINSMRDVATAMLATVKLTFAEIERVGEA